MPCHCESIIIPRCRQANERNILQAVHGLPAVQAVFECGLFESRLNPCWAVSPAGIAVVRGSDNRSRCWTVEAKTETRITSARTANQIGVSLPQRTAWCRLGDTDFKRLIPVVSQRRQVRGCSSMVRHQHKCNASRRCCFACMNPFCRSCTRC